MDILLIGIKGVLAGLAIAAPVGPVGVLCVQRTVNHGRVAGLVSGFGAALADLAYGCIAAFSLTLVASWLQAHEIAFRLAGGALLLVLGGRMLRTTRQSASTDAAMEGEGRSANHHLSRFASTFVLTATNPITIVAFLGIFAFLDVGAEVAQLGLAFALVTGVFIGSWLWWLAIALAADRFGRRLQAEGLVWVARGSGTLIIGFGIYGLVSGAIGWLA